MTVIKTFIEWAWQRVWSVKNPTFLQFQDCSIQGRRLPCIGGSQQSLPWVGWHQEGLLWSAGRRAVAVAPVSVVFDVAVAAAAGAAVAVGSTAPRRSQQDRLLVGLLIREDLVDTCGAWTNTDKLLLWVVLLTKHEQDQIITIHLLYI